MSNLLAITMALARVAVPVRGVGCVIIADSAEPKSIGVAVPVRGVGCVEAHTTSTAKRSVAVPVRGVGCVGNFVCKAVVIV